MNTAVMLLLSYVESNTHLNVLVVHHPGKEQQVNKNGGEEVSKGVDQVIDEGYR